MKKLITLMIICFLFLVKDSFAQYGYGYYWYRPYFPYFYGYYGFDRVPIGKREAAAWGTFIGGAIGYGASGNPRGAAIGSGVGALVGLMKPSKKKNFVPAPPWAYRQDYRDSRDSNVSRGSYRSYRIKKEKKMLRYNVENHTEFPITVIFKPRRYGRATTIRLSPFEGMEVQLPWKVQNLKIHALVLTEEGVMPNNLQPVVIPGEIFEAEDGGLIKENDTIQFFVPDELKEE